MQNGRDTMPGFVICRSPKVRNACGGHVRHFVPSYQEAGPPGIMTVRSQEQAARTHQEGHRVW